MKKNALLYPVNKTSMNWQMLVQTSHFVTVKLSWTHLNWKYTARKFLQEADVMWGSELSQMTQKM